VVFSRNAEREARLLDEWRNGTTAREAARKTGDPEGTVYYYWKKFSRDPEKANRLAASLKPRRKLSPMDITFQTIALKTADDIDRKYNQLVKEGKYPQSEYFLRAEVERRRLRREIVSDVNSVTALYLANPEESVALIPDVARELVQIEMEKGSTLPEAVEKLENSLSVLFLFEHTKHTAAMLGLGLEALRKDYLAKQESKEGEPSEKTADPEPSRPASISEMIEPGVGKGNIPKKKMSFTEFIESAVKHDEEESKRMTREAAAKGRKVTVRELIFKERPTPQPPDAGLSEMRVDLDPEMKKKLSKLRSGQFANGPTPGDMKDPRRIRPSQEPPKRRTTKETKESKSDDEKGR